MYILCHINGTVDNWLLQMPNAEKWSCAHWRRQRGSAGAFRKAAIIPTSTDEHNQSPESILSASKHKLSKQHYIRRSCSAAAKWKRKFSVTGGKWCCFKLSSVILESSHSSARDTKFARISFVLTEISCESQLCCQVRLQVCFLNVHVGAFGMSHLNNLTLWLLGVFCSLHDKVTNVFV